jgi:transposase
MWENGSMNGPVNGPMYVRELTSQERAALKAALGSTDARTLRRSQILLASARGERPSDIARSLGCAVQTVRNTIHAFHKEGVECLQPKRPGPKYTHPIFDQHKREQLQALLHRSPRDFDKPTSVWTLDLAVQVCAETGLTEGVVSDETVRKAITRLGVGWRRAKKWISSPDPQSARKKSDETT